MHPPTTDQSISDAAISTPDHSMQGPELAGDPQQLDYPARPMTPRAEDYPVAEDAALYRQLFTNLFQSKQKNQMILMEETLFSQTALHRPVVESEEKEDDLNAGDAIF